MIGKASIINEITLLYEKAIILILLYTAIGALI